MTEAMELARDAAKDKCDQKLKPEHVKDRIDATTERIRAGCATITKGKSRRSPPAWLKHLTIDPANDDPAEQAADAPHADHASVPRLLPGVRQGPQAGLARPREPVGWQGMEQR